MFSFDTIKHDIREYDVVLDEMETKYRDKYMVFINVASKDMQLRGDLVAVLSPDEYAELRKHGALKIPQNYTVLKGVDLLIGGLGAYGLYL